MKKTSVTRLRGGGVQANLVVQLFNLALVYQSSLPNFEGRLYLQSWERYSAATRVGGTTQDKRSPKGHNRGRKILLRKNQELAATVSRSALCGRCQMSDVFMFDVRSFNGPALGVR